MIINAGDYGFNWDDVSYWRQISERRVHVWFKSTHSGNLYVELFDGDARAFMASIVSKQIGNKL